MADNGKKKRGRPATGETPKRYFRMADDEYDQVTKAAEKTGRNISEYIRDVMLAHAKRILKK